MSKTIAKVVIDNAHLDVLLKLAYDNGSTLDTIVNGIIKLYRERTMPEIVAIKPTERLLVEQILEAVVHYHTKAAPKKQGFSPKNPKVTVEQVVEAVKANGGNKNKAARALNVSEKLVRLKMIKAGLAVKATPYSTNPKYPGSNTNREEFMKVLKSTGGNQRATARILGISDSGVRNRLKRMGVVIKRS